MIDFDKAKEKLSALGQEHLMIHWEMLSVPQRTSLLNQIEDINTELFWQQRALLSKKPDLPPHFAPFKNYAMAGSQEDFVKGKELIAEGKMGALLIAGGQGTRLRFDGPKGMVPLSVIKYKSLFQLFAEKVLAAGKQAGRWLPVAVMTSPLNHEQTFAFFRRHEFFQLQIKQISFFVQEMLPLLDEQGNLFLESPWTIARGPDGNGGALGQFYRSGIWGEWMKQGVSYLNFVLVDNVLADPFDAELVGFHHRQNSHVTIKCTPRCVVDEKVGVVVQSGEQVRVVEYSEMPDQEKKACDATGVPLHRCANLSLYCLGMDFVEKVAHLDKATPLHLAKKAVKYLNGKGETVMADQPMAWKFEKFIFDMLPYAQRISALLYPREKCFAPLKNEKGEDSLETVRTALQGLDREVFHQLTGVPSPKRPFELSQDFHYPTAQMIRQWKGRSLSNNTDYVEVDS